MICYLPPRAGPVTRARALQIGEVIVRELVDAQMEIGRAAMRAGSCQSDGSSTRLRVIRGRVMDSSYDWRGYAVRVRRVSDADAIHGRGPRG